MKSQAAAVWHNQIHQESAREDVGSLLNIHKCLDIGAQNIRLSQSFCGKNSSHDQGVAEKPNTLYVVNGKVHCDTRIIQKNCSTVEYGQCGSYEPPGQVLCPDPTLENDNDTGTWLEATQNTIKNTKTLLEGMTNCSTVTIKTDQIRGIITKLPSRNNDNIILGITTTTIAILGDNTDSTAGMSLWVKISGEASEKAVRGNGSFLELSISGGPPGVPGFSLLNNKVVRIEMGAKIFNLSETIDIHFRNVDKKGNVASCMSWDGKGNVGIFTFTLTIIYE
ncbi:uncharacterized protein LOC141806775 [Halichoeres trimaculatus]|uniref:uncharacterized protein LOC141806775 n=1 Tax=Halichoeres trimaculatus TaxID=147232 RepID=UPI003D9E8031